MKSNEKKRVFEIYNPKKIETKWQKFWLEKKTFFANEKAKGKKKFVLIEFPYPSGAGLHMGHMRPFVAGDVVSKYYKLKGFNTMYPIGWDAFGLPAENYAIKNKVHPSVATKKNISNAKKQLFSWGTGFDWGREINTTDPEYYKWTQKLFLEFYKAGLAYEKFGEINWCPKDKTGLANEEVIDGKCDRCGETVEKKNLRQWYLKITDYAEKLLEGLKKLPDWPEAVKIQQENWIGRSEGAEIRFKIQDLIFKKEIGEVEVFTTRADTLFGVTYVVLAPEIAERFMNEDLEFKSSIQNTEEIKKYIEQCKSKTEEERTNDKKEKTGVEIKGIKAINPANGEEVLVWVADYVLGNYGTGAVMAVPAHDERDFEFAKKFGLPIKQVVSDKTNYDNVSQSTNLKFLTEIAEFSNTHNIRFILTGGLSETLLKNIKKAKNSDIDIYVLEKDFQKIDTFFEKKGLVKSSYKEEYGWNDIFSFNNDSVWVDVFILRKDNEGFFDNINDKPFYLFKKESELIDIIIPQTNQSILCVSNNTLNKFYNHISESVKKIFTNDGILKRSGKFSGTSSEEARKKITEFVGGKIVTKYKLRDWVFSRQRYWGEPIPLIHCDKCGIVPVPEKDLPVKLPNVKNYEPTGTGESPLATINKWVNTKCPKCIEESKKTKYLVFDFDGVIGDTFEANLHARIDVGWAKDLKESREKMYHYFTNRPHHANGHNYSGKEIKKLLEDFRNFGIATKKYGFKLFDSFIKEIKKIKNTKIAIISSGSEVYVYDGAKKSKLKCDYILTCEDSLSKEEKLEFLSKKWKVNIKDLYYFTDSTADVYELENIMDKSKIIGCSWGYIGFNELKKGLPENQILKKYKDIHNLFKPKIAKRETNTMPQWAGSSWYWLRYMDPKNKKEFASLKNQKYWSPVDLYFGGMEHTTLHLLYSRFWNLVFKDRKIVSVSEPYKKRIPHGIILGPDGEKMSKSRGNVVNPDDLIKIYGADTVRLYMMFLGPHGAQVAWNDKGIVGARRFVERVFGLQSIISKKEPKEVTTALHKTIKKVEEDIENTSFNTAVSAMMIFVNTVFEHKAITEKSFLSFIKILSPLAPHIAEELWQNLNQKGSVFNGTWPKFDAKLLKSDTVPLVVQINGKFVKQIDLPAGLTDEDIVKSVKTDEKVAKLIEKKLIKKVIVVKDKIVNFVV